MRSPPPTRSSSRTSPSTTRPGSGAAARTHRGADGRRGAGARGEQRARAPRHAGAGRPPADELRVGRHGRRRDRLRLARSAAQARQHRARSAGRAVDRGRRVQRDGPQAVPRGPRHGADRGGRRPGAASASRAHVSRRGREVPADGRSAAGGRRADRAGAARRRRAVGLRRLAVVGWPVAHSRSPAMQNAALAAVGLDGEFAYEAVAIEPGAFAETVAAMPAAGFVGLNVTIPHKEAALAIATDRSDDASAIGAANTLTFGPDGAIRADNTDAPGLLDALGDPPPRTALVLGAGGSARAAAHALGSVGASVAVWNRTPGRARRLAAALGVAAVDAPVVAEVLVNCTAAGMQDRPDAFKEMPVTADDLGEYACVVDLVYRDGGTELLRQAERRGCRCVDGLEILVRQGARSFQIWTGRSAPLDVMRRAARSGLQPSQLPSSAPGLRGGRADA